MSVASETVDQPIQGKGKLTDNFICSEDYDQDDPSRSVNTFDTKAFETVDNDRECWFLGVLPPS